MKKIISLALMLVVASALVIATSAAVPTPWFDLAFDGDGVIDAQGNATPEIYGGYVQDTTVVVDGTEYAINCYYGGTGEMPGECIEVALPFDAEGVEFSEFILGGSTIEVVFQIDNPLAGDQSGNAGLFTSCYGGGYSLYHADGLYSFYMSSATNNNYVSANSIDVPVFGELVMLQGVFVPEENALYLYQNGEMYGAAAWTEGDTYRWGNAFSDTLGIGINCSYTSESVGDFSPYKIVDARLYNVALTEEQAAERWAEVLAQVTSGEAAPATAAPATEAPATEAPATEAPATEAPATEAPATEAPATEPVALEGTFVVDWEGVSVNHQSGRLAAGNVAYSGAQSLMYKAYSGGLAGGRDAAMMYYSADKASLAAGKYKVTFWACDPFDMVAEKSDGDAKLVMTFHAEGQTYLFEQTAPAADCGHYDDPDLCAAYKELVDFTNGQYFVEATGKVEEVNGETWTQYGFEIDLPEFNAVNFYILQPNASTTHTDGTYYVDYVEITAAGAAEAPATQAPATEAPATEAPATEAPATEAPATEAPATEAPATEAPATQAPSEVVDQAAQTFDFGVIAAVAAVVSLAGYAVSKKH